MEFIKTNFAAFAICCSILSCSNDDVSQTIDSNLNCLNQASVFQIQLDGTDCQIDIQQELNVSSIYSEIISGTTREITVNGIANHRVGEFPNAGNPNSIAVSIDQVMVTTEPSISGISTPGQGYSTAVLFSGVLVDPFTAEFFTGPNGINPNWNITTLQTTTNLGLDCNNAHVQPTGKYHYHGTPSAYMDELGVTSGVEMVKVGYAADGFPLYYKYGYSSDGNTIIAYDSGYQLKTTDRGGDGSSAPSGCPDGYYFQDYEYVDGISELDECNGKFGKTPESENEYYYVITDNFPSVPICFSGTPDDSFNHMP